MNSEMMNFLDLAKRSKMNIQSTYYPDLIFTPEALKDAWDNGTFRWGLINWVLVTKSKNEEES